jgi:tetratricopeptide (TPR) repeat protein
MRRQLISRGMLSALLIMAATVVDVAAQSGRVSGVVKDERARPIKGATVVARSAVSSGDAFKATSDDNGVFELVGPAGPWSVAAEKSGYEAGFLDLEIRPQPATNPTVTLTLTLKPARIEGAVTGKDLQQRLVDADYFYNINRWDEAITAYRRILADAPAMSVVNLQIAAAYRNKREYTRALAAYGDLLKSDPANDKAMVGMAMTNLESGDLESAERSLEAAAESPGATREVFYNLGEMKLAKAKTAEALQAYRRAAEIDPAWGKPLFAMGRVARGTGDVAGALKYFAKVIEVDPRSPEAEQAKAAIEQLKK